MKEDQLQEGEGHGLFTLKNVLLLLVGFVLGYIIKGQAVQNITMGYDDYKIITNEEKLNNEIKLEEKNDVNVKEDANTNNDINKDVPTDNEGVTK